MIEKEIELDTQKNNRNVSENKAKSLSSPIGAKKSVNRRSIVFSSIDT